MDWVHAENARTAKVLESDPRFAKYSAEALTIGQDPHRLAYPKEHGTDIYNTWQDAQHVQGILRKTTRQDRVGPQHARKFAAMMEEYHEPFFYDETVEEGHGAGAILKEKARTSAETYVYQDRVLVDSH